jgi:hypothetical protein
MERIALFPLVIDRANEALTRGVCANDKGVSMTWGVFRCKEVRSINMHKCEVRQKNDCIILLFKVKLIQKTN